jgi:hypothetical protein
MANGLYQIIIEKLDKRFLMMNFEDDEFLDR